ncbi:MAG: DUF1579 domain-containing protein [Pirellulaceae bacterium]
MKRLHSLIALAVVAMLGIATVGQAQVPEMPKPTEQHELLKQFAGKWRVAAETVPAPGMEAMKIEGTETSEMVGGFWLVSKGESTMEGMPMRSVLTIGYDPAVKKYIGTFFCSADSTLWKYEGEMDESGKKLTLMTEGPSPIEPGKQAKYREVLELKDKDHKVFTSYLQDAEGGWITFVTMQYERVKQPKPKQ